MRAPPSPPPETERALTWIETPLGPLVAAASQAGVCVLEFTDRPMPKTQLARVRKWSRRALRPDESPHLARLRTELGEYFAGSRKAFDVSLDAPGTPFEERVWAALLRIPCGETRTYGDIAEGLGARGAQRAVGRANGMNRISVLIPCHRLVGKDGTLCGYGGGLWRKHALLHLERTGEIARRTAL